MPSAGGPALRNEEGPVVLTPIVIWRLQFKRVRIAPARSVMAVNVGFALPLLFIFGARGASSLELQVDRAPPYGPWLRLCSPTPT